MFALRGLAVLVLLYCCEAYHTTPEAFGAVGDGKANDWVPIQRALASCSEYSNCTILFAASYRSGPLVVNTSDVTLNIMGSLYMLAEHDYPKQTGAFINTAVQTPPVSNLHITGTGTIGNADALDAVPWWSCKYLNCWRPHLIVITKAVNFRLDSVTLKNSPNHHIEIGQSNGTRVDNIKIEAPLLSPNTDGINFYGGHNQSFTNSHVRNGDDCVSVVPIGEFSPPCVDGDPTQPACRGGNVVVRNVYCEGGHGISIGGVRHGTVSNVTFSNMTATAPFGNTQDEYASGGLRVKAYPNATGQVYNITFEDIDLQGVYLPLQLLGHYCPFPCKTPGGNRSVTFHDITFRNIRGTGRSDTQAQFDCTPWAPCVTRIELDNVHLGTQDGSKAKFTCSNAHISANNSSPSTCSAPPM